MQDVVRGPGRVEVALRGALVELGAASDVGAITVSALVRRARVGRTTFYRHHADIGSYLESLRTRVLDELCAAFRAAQREAGRDAGLYPVLTSRIGAVLAVVEEHAELLPLLCRGPEGAGFRPRCRRLLSGLLAEDFAVLGARIDAAYCPPDYLLAFLSHAFVGTVETWAANPRREPVEDMTFYLAALMSGSTAEFLEPRVPPRR
ncbi:TetR-like C-terminal domain-containing protein [Saccharopolyspora sp. NPDC047091]|uniref:TetR/AcrR family transcriptional regulator n=1 Tax=Saccharopolyspora sp. NPDC047091 TaxID=3155924 RepID=UPI0033C9FE71